MNAIPTPEIPMQDAHTRLRTELATIYGAEQSEAVYRRLTERLSAWAADLRHTVAAESPYFSERTITVITYGDTLRSTGEAPLATLHRFLLEHVRGLIDTVHILPFYPWSSDDGFSVKDYYQIDPALGTWADVERLGNDFRLMFDAVINHMSAEGDWFQAFLAGVPDYQGRFFVESPLTDLSRVTRPRTSPLLTPFRKANGETVHLWTTFSADQIDLDYRDPSTLLALLDVMIYYVSKGAQVLRLDAIAYMWKQPGTSSIHLPQTHAIIRLLRAVMDVVAPHVILITETNVPHAENISYFGSGTNEAQLVYNFTLPPLLLHSLRTEDAHKLSAWLNTLQVPSARTAFFNFTASHDGIGVRPVEGILTRDEVAGLIDHVTARGGRVSYKRNSDGSDSPYELNITYVDACGDPALPADFHVRRFLLSQAIMLAMAGVPAIYLHSLLGSRNDTEGMLSSGINRRINRAKLAADTTALELVKPDSFRSQVFAGYKRLLRARIGSRAFHPAGAQHAEALNQGRVLALRRTAPDTDEAVLGLFNLSGSVQQVTPAMTSAVDLLTGEALGRAAITLQPYELCWLSEKPARA